MDLSRAGFSTRAIHEGQTCDPAYGALSVPIYQTSTFCFESAEEGIGRFDGSKEGYVYSRGGNPTVRALELKMAALEGGEDCVACGSGIGAVGAVMIGLLQAGDHVLVGECIYGCSHVVICDVLPKFGIDATPVDTTDLDAVRAAITPKTKMIYFETPTNPMMRLTDIAALRDAIGTSDVRIVVDGTFAPPPVQFPLALGADIVIHSATKYLNGHGDVVAGVVVGTAEDIALIKSIGVTKTCGCICSPFDAFLIIRGLQTLDLRVRRHCESALTVASYLETSPFVKRVMYPGLPGFCDHDLAQRQMNGLYTGILSFELHDGICGMTSFEAGKRLINTLGLAHVAVSLGDPASLIQHPATMTHHNVADEAKRRMGITDGILRLSVGLEDTCDIIADFEQAFERFARSVSV